MQYNRRYSANLKASYDFEFLDASMVPQKPKRESKNLLHDLQQRMFEPEAVKNNFGSILTESALVINSNSSRSSSSEDASQSKINQFSFKSSVISSQANLQAARDWLNDS